MATPKWISKELFEEALRKFYKDKDLQIYGYSSKAAVPVGENYTSDLYRSNVTFGHSNNNKKDSMSVIVKIQMTGNDMELLTKGMNLFRKEMDMFSNTLPKMYKALVTIGPNMNGCLSSLCLLTTDKPNSILVLQDLQPDGFKMAQRQSGIDLDHCMLVMKKIAQFHAASVVVFDKEPLSIPSTYMEGIFKNDEFLSPWILKGYESLTDSCMECPELIQYGVKLNKIGKECVERGYAASKRRLGGFNVLNHGDLWTNNFLFSYYPDGKLKDLKFVDFQIVHYSSPAVDLHYFLSTSPTDEVRQKHVDLLLDIYYGHLVSNLSAMGHSLEAVPSREDFRRDYESRGFHGVIAAATVSPLVKASHRNDATFEDLMKSDGEDSFRNHCYTNEIYRANLKLVLSYYDKLGTLN